MADLATPPNLQSLILAEDVQPGDTTMRTLGRFEKSSLSGDNKYIVGRQEVTLSPFTDRQEVCQINVTSAPTLVTGTTNTYQYTFTKRGLHTDSTDFPSTKFDSEREKTHYANRSSVLIGVTSAWFQQIQNNLIEATTSFENNAGEAIDASSVGITVSIDSRDISAIADYGGTVTGTVKATTSAAHGYTTGDTVDITGTTDYNGTHSITVIDSTNFYFTETYTSSQTGKVTDNTLHKYHKTNYPNAVGMISPGASANYANGEAATWSGAGAVVTGLTGLVPGLYVYAENTGTYTQTSSATTTVIGIAISSVSALIFLAPTEITKATESVARTGTDDINYISSLGVQQGIQSSAAQFGTASGTDTYAVTLTPTLGAYVTGQELRIKFTNANTGAATLNIDTVGAKAIQIDGSALVAGDIAAGSIKDFVYDGTQFQMLTPSSRYLVTGDIITGSKRIASFTTDVSIASSTSETALFSFTLPGGSLKTEDVVKVRLYFNGFDISSSQSATIRGKYGATTMCSAVVSQSSYDPAQGMGFIDFVLYGRGTTSTQDAALMVESYAASSGFFRDLVVGTASEDSTGDLTVAITIQFSASSVDDAIIARNGYAELISSS